MAEPTLDVVIQKAVHAIETIAPEAWRLLVTEQRLDAGVTIVQCTVITVVASVMRPRLRRQATALRERENQAWAQRNYISTGHELYTGASYILIVFAFIACMGIPGECARLFAPDVYAAKALVEAAK